MTEKINQKSTNKPEIILVLHNIRSTHNVGSLFRSSDGAGVAQIVLSGYTPTPIDKYGRNRNDIAKTALGAEQTLPWQQVEGLPDFIKQKRDEGFLISAIEQTPNSINYKNCNHDAQKQILILGNEVLGVDNEILNLCDQVIEIPMAGDKESLNVSIAGAIVLFELLY
jgi:tRNA G18 (ribose-2'-O)-methylase SpoU